MTTSRSEVTRRKNRIKDVRQYRGWSQKHLAKESGISQGNISRYENQEMQPSIESLMMIGRALDFEWRNLVIDQ